MATDGLGMCVSDNGVNEPAVKGISSSEEVCNTRDRGVNGGDRYGGIRGDRLVSEKSNDQKGEMVTGVNRQRVEGVNQRSSMGDSRREMVVNAVRKEGAGWEAIVGTEETRHGDSVIQIRRLHGERSDVQEVTTLMPHIHGRTGGGCRPDCICSGRWGLRRVMHTEGVCNRFGSEWSDGTQRCLETVQGMGHRAAGRVRSDGDA